MNRKLVKIDYIYEKSRELFIFITKKKEEKDTSKGNQTARAEAWRARFLPRSVPPRINNTPKFRLLLQRLMYRWTENLSKSIIYTSGKLSRELFIFITKKKRRKAYIEKERKHGELDFLQDQLLLELIIQVYFSITFPAFNVSMNRKLVKIDYILYMSRKLSRKLFIFITKKKKKRIEKERKRRWSVESSKIRPRINNTSKFWLFLQRSTYR